jgi:hypothetical protein
VEEEQTIAVRRLDATAHLALQHNQMMRERRILGFKSAVRLNGEANSLKMKHTSATIVADGKRFAHQITTDEVFGTHRRSDRPATALA